LCEAVTKSINAETTWPAPAKINLFLHVTGRRADGYHTLQTVFRFLDFGDEVSIRVCNDGRIRRASGPKEVPEQDDLCVRAARLLKEDTGTTLGANISVTKRIPMGGGLGGGSSDAATTLLALNRLWRTRLPRQRLAELGLSLGADVPVFIFGRSAWAEGVGEKLKTLALPPQWYLVLAPPVRVSTADIFRSGELTAFSPAIKIRGFRAGRGGNDLEAVVRRRYPQVGAVLDWLAQFGAARMTGSGACVFLPVPSRAAGERILDERPAGCEGFVARGRDRHPLLRMPADTG
jgi:4-diphosphocytidyl-2-C-methyl-D-erythritol kinase